MLQYKPIITAYIGGALLPFFCNMLVVAVMTVYLSLGIGIVNMEMNYMFVYNTLVRGWKLLPRPERTPLWPL